MMSDELILKKLDERKLAARKTLLEENPMPEGYNEDQIEEMQDRWEEVLNPAKGDQAAIEVAIRGGLRSGHPLEKWLISGGDDWLPDIFADRDWGIKRYFEILALNAPSLKIRHAALDLATLSEEYEAADWKPKVL